MHSYGRDIFYYETDGMAVVHHSNFVRWLEEARVDWLRSDGISLEEMEEKGILCPIVGLEVGYRRFARFGESFRVELRVVGYTGAKLKIGYRVMDGGGRLIAEAGSIHGFVGRDYRPVSLKKSLPRFHQALMGMIERGEEGA